jgi:excisionase family DNA binding protein
MPVGTFVNVNEAATMLGCTVGRVRQMLRDGSLRGLKANAKAWLVPTTEIERMQEKPYSTGRPRIASEKRLARS